MALEYKNDLSTGSGFNNTPGRLPLPYDYGSGGGSSGFGRYGSLSDVQNLLRSKKITNAKSYARLMGGGVGEEMNFFNQNTGRRLGALDNAFQALDPANLPSSVDWYAQNAMGGVQGQSDRIYNTLRRSYGDQASLKAGAGLSALNQANNQIGGFRNQVMNPFNLSNMYMQQAGAFGAGNVFQGLPFALQAFGMGQNQPKSPTTLDTIAGLAGTAFSGGWQPF